MTAQEESGSAPLVSIVVIAYDQAATIGAAVRSAVEQSEPSVEVLVVDDGSQDDSAERARAAGAHRVLVRTNGGPAAARNTGLHAASGEWVLFLDGDDVLHPDAVRTQLDALAAQPDAQFAIGRNRLVDERDRPLPGHTEPRHTGDLYPQLLAASWICPPSALLARRSAVLDVGGWHEGTRYTSAEDLHLYLALAREVPGVDHTAVVTDYRLHEGMSSRSYSRGLDANLAVLAGHGPDDGDPAVATARRAGEQHYRRTYGTKAVLSDWTHAVRARRGWVAATSAVVGLVVREPRAVRRVVGEALARRGARWRGPA